MFDPHATNGSRTLALPTKSELRKQLRAKRREHVAQLPEAMRGLVFRHPPGPVLEKIGPDAVIGLYHAGPLEAPTTSYAGYFLEGGHREALPRFASRQAPMEFAMHSDPFGESDLEVGPFGMLQPSPAAELAIPDVLFVPLIGFTPNGDRLGQGGGHYDRWLAEHPGRITIGLAWDVQLCDALPSEPHDIGLDAVITPTRIYGPF
jgi:5-formyltetrahydrofolate cyclo-ligase